MKLITITILTLLVINTSMAKTRWAAGNYMGSGMSKEQYLGKTRSSGYKKPSQTYKPKNSGISYNQSKINAANNAAGVSPMPEGWGDSNSSYWSNPTIQSQAISDVVSGRKGYQVDTSQAKRSREKPDNNYSKPRSVSPKNQANLENAQRNAANLAAESARRNTFTGLATSTLGDLLSRAKGAVTNVTGANIPDWNLSETLGLNKGFKTPSGADILGALGVSQADASMMTPEEVQNLLGNSDMNSLGLGWGETPTKTTPTPTDTGGGKRPRPVTYSTPWYPVGNLSSTGSGISQAYTTNNPNNTQIQNNSDNTQIQNNPGTVQRPVGMGLFSSGQYANGKGGYGFQGSLGGNNGLTDQTNPINDFLTTLGIMPQTAQASEMPQNPYTDRNYIESNTSPAPGVTRPDLYSMQGNLPVWNTQFQNNNPVTNNQGSYQNPGGSMSGGVTQQFSQATPGQQKFDMSGYKEAQKAQKKALDELIKSIKAQYSQSKTEGTNALNKSKQEDLLKLSGLFNFANQDPNSEQRIQYEQRSRNDYAGQLVDFLNKLAQGEAKDVSGARQNYQQSIADILTQQQKAQSDYENMMWDRQYKMATLNKKGSGSGVTWTYTYDPTGQFITGSVGHDKSGNIYYNPGDSPIQAKGKTQSIWDQMGGINFNNPNG